MTKIKFRIVTPERVVYQFEVDSVTCPTQMGEVTILPNHIPLAANLKPGELRFKTNGEEKSVVVSGGFLEVRPLLSPPSPGDGEGLRERSRSRTEVIILADAAEHEQEIDIVRAEEARARAQQLMSEKRMTEEEYAETLGALERSLARLKVAGKRKYKDVGKQQEF